MSTDIICDVAIAILNEAKTMSIPMSDGAAMRLARTALKALRKPTPEMVDAMKLAWAISSMRPPGDCSKGTLVSLYQHAIDEARNVNPIQAGQSPPEEAAKDN